MDLYSSGLSLLATGIRVPRPVATGIDAAIATVGTILVVFFAGDFLAPFMGFLTTLGSIIAAWAGIMIAEAIMRKKNIMNNLYLLQRVFMALLNWEAISLLIVGTIVDLGSSCKLHSLVIMAGILIRFRFRRS